MRNDRIGILAEDIRDSVRCLLEGEPELTGTDAGKVSAIVGAVAKQAMLDLIEGRLDADAQYGKIIDNWPNGWAAIVSNITARHSLERAREERDAKFAAHLKEASAIVAGWPEWKRNLLGRPTP